MGYCSISDIQNIIAQSLTSATSTSNDMDTLGSLLNIGKVFDTNLVTTEILNSYISMADQEIDAILNELYSTPFCETANFETELYSDIYEYNPFLIFERVCPLAVGNQVVLVFGDNEERHEIDEVVSPTIFSTLEPIGYEFPAGTRVTRVTFPSAIRYISARMASATIYDKYFAAESSPNVSTFGKYLRDMARREINNILQGRTIIHGQHRIGRRFYNANLDAQYGLPLGPEGEKNIDTLI